MSHVTHRKSRTRMYNIWKAVKRRCYNKNVNEYVNYGGRGIKMCDKWRNEFMSFYDWSMNNGYTDNSTIDRINNNGNYEPNNCRWVDRTYQSRNRRNNIEFTYNGETHCLSEWCEILCLNYSTIKSRLRYGWSIERALELK